MPYWQASAYRRGLLKEFGGAEKSEPGGLTAEGLAALEAAGVTVLRR